jgi:hypothetical protein
MRVRHLLPAALAAALLLAPPAGATPRMRGVSISNLFPDTSLETITDDLDEARRLGANTVRVDVSWSLLEPAAAGELDPTYIGLLDQLVAGAAQRHIKPTLLLLRSPCWASSAPGAPGTCAKADAYPPRDPAQYGRIAGALVARYRGKLAGFEVWNEPDHATELYFAGPGKPERYAAILRSAYAAIKAADGAVKVLGGSLVGANGTFLRALYRAGIKGHYDALSVHYYDLTLASVRSIRAVQRAAHDTRPLWLNEFGWTSCYPRRRTQGGHDCVTRQVQARNLADLFRALRGSSFVQGAIVYNLHDDKSFDFGVVSRDGGDKPAFATLRRAFRGALGRPRGLTVSVSGGVVRGSAPAGDIVSLRVHRRTGGDVYHAALAPDRNGRFHLSLPGAARGGGLVVIVEQPWTRRHATAAVR